MLFVSVVGALGGMAAPPLGEGPGPGAAGRGRAALLAGLQASAGAPAIGAPPGAAAGIGLTSAGMKSVDGNLPGLPGTACAHRGKTRSNHQKFLFVVTAQSARLAHSSVF